MAGSSVSVNDFKMFTTQGVTQTLVPMLLIAVKSN
jgi:hypothetical protein